MDHDDGSGRGGENDGLETWLASVRVDDAARSRSRVRSLEAHAAEDATVVGVLADLHERDATVLLTTVAGRRHRGRVLLVGPDAVVLQVGGHEWLLTRLSTVGSVRVPGDAVHGEGAPTTSSSFGRILAAAAEPGERVRLLVGGEVVAGVVMATSLEVAVLRLDNGDLAYVNLATVEEATLRTGAG